MRILCFIGALSLLWLPLAIPLHILLGDDPNLVTIIAMSLLFVELLFLWQLWSKHVYQENNVFTRYGLERSSRNSRELIKGLALGFWLCLGLFIFKTAFGWAEVTNSQINLLKLAAEGLLSALGIALGEELIFRGWLLDELSRDYSKTVCLWVSAAIFALAHFLKSIDEIIRTAITFPALMLLGITLVLAKQKYGDRLGICIGIHAGLVWGYYIVNVGELIEYTDKVPTWVTGIDNNPIAGVMGLLFLTGLMYSIARLPAIDN
ncbi:MAG: type II CAAX endopeptidase family protein [Cyanobacteria bacterium P01_G01_bin.19]